jgi:hypothetical protein
VEPNHKATLKPVSIPVMGEGDKYCSECEKNVPKL